MAELLHSGSHVERAEVSRQECRGGREEAGWRGRSRLGSNVARPASGNALDTTVIIILCFLFDAVKEAATVLLVIWIHDSKDFGCCSTRAPSLLSGSLTGLYPAKLTKLQHFHKHLSASSVRMTDLKK